MLRCPALLGGTVWTVLAPQKLDPQEAWPERGSPSPGEAHLWAVVGEEPQESVTLCHQESSVHRASDTLGIARQGGIHPSAQHWGG